MSEEEAPAGAPPAEEEAAPEDAAPAEEVCRAITRFFFPSSLAFGACAWWWEKNGEYSRRLDFVSCGRKKGGGRGARKVLVDSGE